MFSLRFAAPPVIGLMAILIIAGASTAEDEYDLRGPAPVKGQVISLNSKTIYKDAVRTLKAGDKSVDDRFNEVVTREKEISILAVNGSEITRFRTKILKDEAVETRGKGKRNREVRKNKLDGQIVYSEMIKGDWKHSLEDAVPTAEQKKSLLEFQELKSEDALLPTGKHKVGYEWKIETPQFQKAFGKKLKDITGKGNGKFLRLEKLDGEDVAVLDVDFEMSGRMDDDEMKMEMKVAGKQTIFRSLKSGYDVKGIGDVKMTAKGKGEVDGMPVELDFSANIHDDETSKVKSP